jgi:hypothetical protein
MPYEQQMAQLQEENEYLRDYLFTHDKTFDDLYEPSIQSLARYHWTPVEIAKKAADFLAQDKQINILDIGSGVGKFCLVAAHYYPQVRFYGIEQRKSLVDHAESMKDTLCIDNAIFMHGNFTQLNFADYDHFYFFNSFYENLFGVRKIDETIDLSSELYLYYARYLYRELDQKPRGTRLVTYHSLEDEIPEDYCLVLSQFENTLKFWVKQ